MASDKNFTLEIRFSEKSAHTASVKKRSSTKRSIAPIRVTCTGSCLWCQKLVEMLEKEKIKAPSAKPGRSGKK